MYLNPKRIARLTSFWVDDFWASNDAKVHQTQQALIGIARGDWFGTGIGAGIQKYSLLPERHTDMIFAVIGEELGILGMMFVLLSFLFILLKVFKIAKVALQKVYETISNKNFIFNYLKFIICCIFIIRRLISLMIVIHNFFINTILNILNRNS